MPVRPPWFEFRSLKVPDKVCSKAVSFNAPLGRNLGWVPEPGYQSPGFTAPITAPAPDVAASPRPARPAVGPPGGPRPPGPRPRPPRRRPGPACPVPPFHNVFGVSRSKLFASLFLSVLLSIPRGRGTPIRPGRTLLPCGCHDGAPTPHPSDDQHGYRSTRCFLLLHWVGTLSLTAQPPTLLYETFECTGSLLFG